MAKRLFEKRVIIPLHIFSQHIEMFFSSIPQRLRWVPWVVVDKAFRQLENSPKLSPQSNTQTESGWRKPFAQDYHHKSLNENLSNSYIEATLIYQLMQMGFWEPWWKVTEQLHMRRMKDCPLMPSIILVLISPRSRWHSAVCYEISPYQFFV